MRAPIWCWSDGAGVLPGSLGPGAQGRVVRRRRLLRDCGSRLIITNAKNRYEITYPNFVCVGRHHKRTACTRKAMLLSVVEELVEDFYAEVQLDAELRRPSRRSAPNPLGWLG